MHDSRSSDEKQRQKDEAHNERKQPGVDKLLRQFLSVETGQGKSEAYRRGHTFNFEWSQQERDAVLKLMEAGKSFEEAFDERKESQRVQKQNDGQATGDDAGSGDVESERGDGHLPFVR